MNRMNRIYRMNRKLMFASMLVMVLVIPAIACYCQFTLGYQLPVASSLVPLFAELMLATWMANGLLVMIGANSPRR